MTAGRSAKPKNGDWCTPPKYVDAVRRVFGGKISLDPCSNEWSIVGAQTEYCLPDADGLEESWAFPTVFVNPPYGIDKERGTKIGHWLRRCDASYQRHGAQVLALIPVATNTGHWKKFVWGRATAICFLFDTRLRFLVHGTDTGKGAPMSCAMVYWGDKFDEFANVFDKFGAVVDIRDLKHRVAINRIAGQQDSGSGPV